MSLYLTVDVPPLEIRPSHSAIAQLALEARHRDVFRNLRALKIGTNRKNRRHTSVERILAETE